jgi:hypothetical protein
LCVDFAPKSGRIDEVDEGPATVDFDHGKPLAVCGLELRVTGDVDLLERLAALRQDSARPLAEVASLRVVEDDARYG